MVGPAVSDVLGLTRREVGGVESGEIVGLTFRDVGGDGNGEMRSCRGCEKETSCSPPEPKVEAED